MPTTHTVTSYKFDELSDAAKEKARDWARQGALDYDWWDSIYDDAARIFVKITGFDLGRRQELTAKFTRTAVETARAIIADHGKECETYKLAQAFIDASPTTHAWLCNACGFDNAPERTTCRDCSEPKAGDEDFDWEAAEDTNNEFLRALRQEYWHILNREMEYRLSDESIDEDIRANEYDFDAHGHRFHF